MTTWQHGANGTRLSADKSGPAHVFLIVLAMIGLASGTRDSRQAVVKILDGLPIPARTYAKQLIMRKAMTLFVERSLPMITGTEINESWDAARIELGIDH